MTALPLTPEILGYPVNLHLLLEYAAFFGGYRYYVYLKRKKGDAISSPNRLSIVLGAAVGALVGSRVFGWLENPAQLHEATFWQLMNAKTIMGGLFGGLLGVELTKKRIGEKRSSGDLFVFPIILGVIVGRVGCFLAGMEEFTYGTVTNSGLGMDLGDGLLRHPIALYEIGFLILLFGLLQWVDRQFATADGRLFQYFMIAYFGFRFFIEFIKPNTFLPLGLSSIQYLCLLCILYYYRTVKQLLTCRSGNTPTTTSP